MKTSTVLRTLALVSTTVVLVGCGSSEGVHNEKNNNDEVHYVPPRELTAQEQTLVQSSNGFGFSFFNEVLTQSDGGNVFVSPLSVSMALGMAYNGARGTTEQGMREALKFADLSHQEVNESYQSLLMLLGAMDSGVVLEVANSLWYREGFTILDEFLIALQTCFNAVVSSIDFDDAAAANQINAWVNEKTRGRIPSIVDGPFDPSTVMFLINAVYFNAPWANKFEAGATAEALFHAPNGDRTVNMMNATRESLYFETDEIQAVELPYGAGMFAMTVLLPKENHRVDEIAQNLTQDQWRIFRREFSVVELTLGLPSFRLDYEATLNTVLAALGMDEAFSDTADFSGITGAQGLYLDVVKHKTFVRVDEEGTEAAAATSVEGDIVSAPAALMIVDRPFLFVIHDRHSETLLFMGRVVNP